MTGERLPSCGPGSRAVLLGEAEGCKRRGGGLGAAPGRGSCTGGIRQESTRVSDGEPVPTGLTDTAPRQPWPGVMLCVRWPRVAGSGYTAVRKPKRQKAP